MKHYFIFILAILLTYKCYSESQSQPTQLTIKQNTYEKLLLVNTISLTDINALKVNTNAGVFNELFIKGYGCSNFIGEPKLPVLKHLIEIPLGAKVKINASNSTYSEYKLQDFGAFFPLMPAQPPLSKSDDPTKIAFKQNGVTYQSNKFLEHELVTVKAKGTMRGINIGLLEISPVYYNPVQKTIRVYTSINIEIVFEDGDNDATIANKEKFFSPYFESSAGKILNYKKLPVKSNLTRYPVKYVIVADPMFQSTLQPFIEWKTKKGFTVIEAYTNDAAVGNTTTSIKTYLETLYNTATPSDPAPSFVLFVGDIAQVPAFNGTEGSHVTDLYYCEYTGDFLPEVYYGRFSATSTEELTPQIEKTLEYEQYTMPSTTFLDTCVMIAGQDASNGPTYGDGQINYGTETYFNAAHGLYSHTYLFAISGSSASQIIQNVSTGVCMANYTAHGGPDGWSNPAFSISDINTLNNAHKYALLVGNCCLTNKFDDPLCFGEALLRASGKGALGYIGGSNSTYWDEDYYWGVGYRSYPSSNPPLHATYDAAQLGAYDRTFHEHNEMFGEWFVTQGQMISAGNLAVTQSGSGSDSYYWEIYHLMGDPSLMVYYSEPPAMSVNYNPLMPLGVTTFDITTDAPYAYAAISKDGVLYGASLADSLGNVTLNLNPITTPGTADLVITCQNKEPHIGTVIVDSPAGPYVLYTKNHVSLSTNGDSLVDYNESVVLDVTLKNFGQADAQGVNAVISTSDPYISITDNSQTWGTINTNSESLQASAYAFSTQNFIPDQHIANFNINIQDNNSNVWNSSFSFKINAPELLIGNFSINDDAGNSNGAIDPGENVEIVITSSNVGHSDAPGTTGTLTTTSPYVTISNGVFNFGTLQKSGSADASFDITVSSSLPDTAEIEFTYTLQSGAYSGTNHYNVGVGRANEDFETGDFTKFEWQQSGNAPWIITNVGPYEGAYSAKSGEIGNNQTSELYITLEVSQPDTISFVKKVSCEPGSNWGGTYYWYDYLEFLIDGTSKGRWDGVDVMWSTVEYPVSNGTHTFKWTYNKDVYSVEGEDCAWIDYIMFPPSIKVIYNLEDIASDDNSVFCYPNPASGLINIGFTLTEKTKVNLCLYDLNGKLVDTFLDNKEKSEGTHNMLVNSSKYSKGIYQLVLKGNNIIKTEKIVIIN